MNWQTKEEIEDWYSSRDPWQYETTADDTLRKKMILDYLDGPYERALDIGAGEGWITKDLPAKQIDFIEWSDNAAVRAPEALRRVFQPEGDYDLIIATGVLYEQYNWQQILDWLKLGKKHVLTSNILEWEQGIDQLGTPVKETTFKYRNYTQHLCLYDFSIQ